MKYQRYQKLRRRSTVSSKQKGNTATRWPLHRLRKLLYSRSEASTQNDHIATYCSKIFTSACQILHPFFMLTYCSKMLTPCPPCKVRGRPNGSNSPTRCHTRTPTSQSYH